MLGELGQNDLKVAAQNNMESLQNTPHHITMGTGVPNSGKGATQGAAWKEGVKE